MRSENGLSHQARADKLCLELQARFGESVRRLRMKAGMTQGELAGQAGIMQSEISRIEQGEINVTIKRMSRLADAPQGEVSDMLRKPG